MILCGHIFPENIDPAGEMINPDEDVDDDSDSNEINGTMGDDRNDSEVTQINDPAPPAYHSGENEADAERESDGNLPGEIGPELPAQCGGDRLQLGADPAPAEAPLKRKRGRPRKTDQGVEEPKKGS